MGWKICFDGMFYVVAKKFILSRHTFSKVCLDRINVFTTINIWSGKYSLMVCFMM